MNKTPLSFVKNCYLKKVSTLFFLLTISLSVKAQTNTNSVTYFEDFNTKGYPSNIPNNSYWTFHNEIHPSQDSWDTFIPGDGNAYIKVDADITNDLDWIHPFQTLEFGGVPENHRLEVRMKGAVVDGGLVGFLFTYQQEGSIFNEVDIEVVANDSATPPHNVFPADGGWTDARFNTWRNANENSARPFTGTKKAIVNQQNEKISLIDDQFHTYTIDWREDKIDFFIDGVLQETLTTNIATGISEVIFGFRQLPWAGGFNWSGTHTMVIDYFKVEPLEIVTFATNDLFTTQFNTVTDLDVLDNDSSNVTIYSFDTTTTEGNTITKNNNLLTFSPTNDFVGQDSFTYTIEDSEGEQITANVFVTVNPRPLEAVDDAITVNIGSSNNIIDVTSNDFYGEYGENSTHPLTLPAGKIVTATNNGAPISVVDGKILYTTPSNFVGIDTFTYTITDGYGYADTAIVTVTVGGDFPAEASNDTFTVDVDTSIDLNVLTNDMPNNATISSFDTNSEEGFPITLSSETFTYSPNGGFTGIDTFSYTIQDSNGNESSAIVTLIVEGINVYTGTLNAEDDIITVAVGSTNTSIDVTNNDNYGENGEHPSHPLTLTNGKLSTASSNGGPINVINNQINYTAPINFTGIDTFTYTITDANGFAATGLVTITVGGSVDAEASDDSFSIQQDTSTNLDVLGNDTPATTIVSYDTISAEGFTVSGSSTELNYTPANGFLGQDSFIYTIEDANGNQSTATVNITVEEVIVSTGPINAVDDTISVNNASTDVPIDVTNNDSFGENGESPSHPLTLTNGKINHASDQGGFISVVNGKVNYSAPNGFTGVDTFIYTITDANGYADTATVTVIVGTADINIQAYDDDFSVDIDTTTDLDVLSNDVSTGATISSFDAISTQGFNISQNGSLLSYSSTGGFEGQDSFTYTIDDGNGTQSTATVNITVEEIVVVTGPINAVDDSITVIANSSNHIIDVTGNDSFGENGKNPTHPLTLVNGKINHASDQGGFISIVNGKVNYSTPVSFVGIDTFTYTITDANGYADTATVSVTVNQTASKAEFNNTLSIEDISGNSFIKDELSIYPNPSYGFIKSNIHSTRNTKATLVIYDVTGKTLYTSPVNIEKGLNNFEFNLDLKPGIAIVKILSPDSNFNTTKIVIK